MICKPSPPLSIFVPAIPMAFFSAEVSILIKPTLSNFQMLLSCAFGINFKKSLPNAGLQRFISMLTFKV